MDMVEKVKEGQQVLLYHRKPRSPKNHAHFFAILNKALEHLDAYNEIDDLLDAVKIGAGHVRTIVLADGRAYYLPKSINFASMDEDRFQRFKERAMMVLSQMLGFDAVLLLPEIEKDNKRVRR